MSDQEPATDAAIRKALAEGEASPVAEGYTLERTLAKLEREAPPRPMSVQEQLNNWFTYHPPLEGQAQAYEQLRAAGKTMAETIVKLCPESADRTYAIRILRDAVFWANASLACGGK